MAARGRDLIVWPAGSGADPGPPPPPPDPETNGLPLHPATPRCNLKEPIKGGVVGVRTLNAGYNALTETSLRHVNPRALAANHH